ncbi:hypothetical protein IB642_00935 [Allofrancisella guangzhouensis]|uniref:Uncharacterized protein n=1 Tax=Allofrancisella guangzhouensis TaxID=594679 RepID=A0A0A8E6C6_9GAMM|nr:hypothetical protein [Allofrancisella guangzhouensis]AJC49117.1 hypothetical protein SD28_05450 [Allofrancisella guangzhouensis]MBK2026832.1 hypothetical protein [Allofrancisella guangzhouensis]MBK2043582.1 hypothetical protein [Allofrancisella guangzhouensis]MBK2046329.1 hypothetical protein [Allofrancisella guangzhouensis]
MKKLILVSVGLLSFVMSYAYMRPADPYDMYDGPEVKEERAEGAAYVPPDSQFINSRYGEYIDNRESEFSPGDDANRLFWSYSQP